MGKTAVTFPDAGPARAGAMSRDQQQAHDSAIKAARALLNKLQGMDASLLAAMMRLPGTPKLAECPEVVPALGAARPTRLHALQDAACLLDDLEAFLDLAVGVPLQALAAPKAASIETGRAQLATRIDQLCTEAGFLDARVCKLATGWVERVAQYMRGYDGHLTGKAWQRSLTTTRTSVRRLSTALHKAPHLEVAPALAASLERLQANTDRLLREIAMRPPGRAEVPDPVAYGAEGVLAIWLRHHERAPTLSRNRSGFVVFGMGLLQLAAAQVAPGGPDWIAPTTFERALRAQVESHRQAQQRGN